MKKIFTSLVLIPSIFLSAQEVSIIPQPTQLTMGKGHFSIQPNTSIILGSSGLEKSASFLQLYIQQIYGVTLPISTKGIATGNIVLRIKQLDHTIKGAYQMEVTNEYISIEASQPIGVFYGVQTLLQLLPVHKTTAINVPQLNIKDMPRFAYRGMHLDVGRHFFTIDFIKKYIDFIAMHKMNTFHWHLTEDQGWRIEIKKYPKLTQVGAYRNGTTIGRYPGTGNTNTVYGGYYTQDQIKEIVQYAAERYIDIIPEIELPGHSSAAIAAYPELSCFPNESTKHPAKTAWNGTTEGKQVQQTWGVFEDVYCPSETTFTFLENVFNEVIALFPYKYIHIGGDECPKDSWKRSAFCQQLIKEKNLKDEHGLQSYFIQRIEKYLNSKGKQIIGWDEILEGGLAPNALVMSWRGEKGGIVAAKQKHQVIMTPGEWVYFDHAQNKREDSVTIGGFTDLQKVYGYEPVPKGMSEEDAQYVLGAQANLWTEYITNSSKAAYMLFPRMSALSEVLWSSKENRNWPQFQERMQQQYKRYELWGTNFNKPAN